MPTYEYVCEKCGLRFDAFQSITAEPLTKCKNQVCDGRVKRVFSTGAGFIFKGSGFYITDYRSDAYKKAAQAESGSATSSAAGDSKKTESTAPSAPSGSTASTSAATTSSGSSK